MKKLTMLLVVAVVVAVAGSVMAFDLGGAVKKGATDAATGVAKGQVEKDINKSLQGKTCNYNPTTQAISGCDLKKISADLAAKRKGVETVGKKFSYTDFDILIHTKDYAAYKAVDNEMKKFGIKGWDTIKKSGSKNKITFSVDIK